jgi:hypothetical protein
MALDKGAAAISAMGQEWQPVTCSLHDGSLIVDHEDDGNPIYGENVGHQPDCLACVRTAISTLEHVRAVQDHDITAQAMHGFALRQGDEINKLDSDVLKKTQTLRTQLRIVHSRDNDLKLLGVEPDA